MNNEDLAEFAKVQAAARTLADAIATNDASKWSSVKEFSFATAYNIIYQIAMRPVPAVGPLQQNLYGTGEELYLKFQQLLAELLRRHPINPQLPQEQLFRAVIQKWNQFLILERWMLKAFNYVSRYFCPQTNRPALAFLSLVIFNQEVFKKHDKVVSAVLLSDIQKLRVGENVDQERMKDAVRLLLKMGFGDRMSPEFVRALLAATADYYRVDSKRCIDSHTPVEYTRRVTSWLAHEAQLASWLLPDHAMQMQFLGEVEKEAVAKHLEFIIDSQDGGFISLLRQGKLQDLKLMLQVMVRPQANGVARMAQLLKRECIEEGERHIQKYAAFTPTAAATASAYAAGGEHAAAAVAAGMIDAKAFVTEFIALHDKYTDLAATCLAHPSFSLAVKEAFETTVNAGVKMQIPIGTEQQQQQQQQELVITVSTSELIARYSDLLLRGGPQLHMSDTELEATVLKIVSFFTRISDKEDFFDCLRASLSRRLLQPNVTNDDKERMFLSKFRAKCGSSATNKLEGMLHDVDASRPVLDTYNSGADRKAMVDERAQLMEFAPLLLTQAFWPAMADEALQVPRSVKDHQDAFLKHYCTGKHHRQLKWIYHYGAAVVSANVPVINNAEVAASMMSSSSIAQVELIGSPYQATVVMCFNETPQLRVEQLVQMTGLTLEEVSRHVHSYASSKVGVLLIGEEGEDGAAAAAAADGKPPVIKIPLDEKQIIRVNSNFQPTQRKLRVPALVPRNPMGVAGGMVPTHSSTMLMGQPVSTGGGMGSAANSSAALAGSGILGETSGLKTEQQRVPSVESVIMKIMKSRQRMDHQQLVMLVTDNLKNRFVPDPKFVKKCIEGLLNRELISRDPGSAETYVFQTA